MSALSKIDKAERLAHLRRLADEWERAHAGELDRVPVGLLDRFSLRNVMLILAQRPDATECAGFHEWRKVGRSVRKGATGVAILVPIGGGPDPESGEDRRPRFTYRYVFDIADTEPVAVREDARELVAVSS